MSLSVQNGRVRANSRDLMSKHNVVQVLKKQYKSNVAPKNPSDEFRTRKKKDPRKQDKRSLWEQQNVTNILKQIHATENAPQHDSFLSLNSESSVSQHNLTEMDLFMMELRQHRPSNADAPQNGLSLAKDGELTKISTVEDNDTLDGHDMSRTASPAESYGLSESSRVSDADTIGSLPDFQDQKSPAVLACLAKSASGTSRMNSSGRGHRRTSTLGVPMNTMQNSYAPRTSIGQPQRKMTHFMSMSDSANLEKDPTDWSISDSYLETDFSAEYPYPPLTNNLNENKSYSTIPPFTGSRFFNSCSSFPTTVPPFAWNPNETLETIDQPLLKIQSEHREENRRGFIWGSICCLCCWLGIASIVIMILFTKLNNASNTNNTVERFGMILNNCTTLNCTDGYAGTRNAVNKDDYLNDFDHLKKELDLLNTNMNGLSTDVKKTQNDVNQLNETDSQLHTMSSKNSKGLNDVDVSLDQVDKVAKENGNQLKSVYNRLDEVQKDLKKDEAKIEKQNSFMKALKNHVDDLLKQLESVNDTSDTSLLQKEMIANKNALLQLQEDLDGVDHNLSREKTDRLKWEEAEDKKVVKNKDDIENLGNVLNKEQNSLDNLQTAVDGTDKDIMSVKSKIDQLEGKANENHNDIGNAEKVIDNHDEDIDTLEKAVKSNADAIHELKKSNVPTGSTKIPRTFQNSNFYRGEASVSCQDGTVPLSCSVDIARAYRFSLQTIIKGSTCICTCYPKDDDYSCNGACQIRCL